MAVLKEARLRERVAIGKRGARTTTGFGAITEDFDSERDRWQEVEERIDWRERRGGAAGTRGTFTSGKQRIVFLRLGRLANVR